MDCRCQTSPLPIIASNYGQQRVQNEQFCRGVGWRLLLAFIVCASTPLTAADPVDLNRIYPATLEQSSQPNGYPWICEETDVWKLSGWSFTLTDKLQIELKSAQVAFGRHDTNVLWAAVFPTEPGHVVVAPAGHGEQVTSVWLRFHPARLSELFPSATVLEQGDAATLAPAKKLAAHKLVSSWHAGLLPMVPQRDSLTIDLETHEGPRRFFAVDTAESSVQYVDAFRSRPLPVPQPIDDEKALQAFDKVWDAFDREYAMFVVKPDVDWSMLRDEYRPRAAAAKTNHDLAQVLADLTARLRDLHVSVTVDGQYLPGHRSERPLNANRAALPKLIGKLNSTRADLSWKITDDSIGYITIDRLTNPKLPEVFLEILPQFEQTRGLVLDLRYNGGGGEPLAQQIAGNVLDQDRVYAASQIRNGPQHADLTPPRKRICRASVVWHYSAPVIVLQGQKTMSSAEAFVLMLSQAPQVTTLGDRTAGSSGNPRELDAGHGIRVRVPQWNPLDADGKPFDAIGISPDVAIQATADEFREDRDPVLSAALMRLRATPQGSGKALQLRPGALDPRDRPHVISVLPSNEANDVSPATEIRVRFDRPMRPDEFCLWWSPDRGGKGVRAGFRLRGEIQYDPKSNEFVFPVQLRPDENHIIAIRSDISRTPFPPRMAFRSAEGNAPSDFEWEFRTRPLRPDDEPVNTDVTAVTFDDEAARSRHIAEVGQSEALKELVGRIRQRRRELKSVVERVTDRHLWSAQAEWYQRLTPPMDARFWWQGDEQCRADYFLQRNSRLLVARNRDQSWARIGKLFVVGSTDAVTSQNVQICDPFLATAKQTDAEIIEQLQLELVGEETCDGAPCHRLRSWRRSKKQRTSYPKLQFRDWLIRADTLLPVIFEAIGDPPLRYAFTYEKIDETLSDEIFAPPVKDDINPSALEPLDANYTERFLNIMDGSSGWMSVRWGKRGPAGTSSSGLN